MIITDLDHHLGEWGPQPCNRERNWTTDHSAIYHSSVYSLWKDLLELRLLDHRNRVPKVDLVITILKANSDA